MPEKKQSAWRFLWRSEDIRKKLLITLGILILFRIAANIPVPGADRDALAAFFNSQGGSGGFLGFLNLLSGWHHPTLLPSLHGCVSLYYGPDHTAVAHSNHSFLAAQNAGRSA